MLGHLDQEPWAWRAADRRLSDAMVSYWANFVRSGDPDDAGLPRWPVFTVAGGQVLQLGDPIAVGGVLKLPTLQVFDAAHAQVRGAQVRGAQVPARRCRRTDTRARRPPQALSASGSARHQAGCGVPLPRPSVPGELRGS